MTKIKREFTEGEVAGALKNLDEQNLCKLASICTGDFESEGETIRDLKKLRWAAGEYVKAQQPMICDGVLPDDFEFRPGRIVRIDMPTTTELVRQLTKAREVIEFYADAEKYHDSESDCSVIWDDEGQRARDFLGVTDDKG